MVGTYMDRRCVYYRKPLLESGTLGTKGNVQVSRFRTVCWVVLTSECEFSTALRWYCLIWRSHIHQARIHLRSPFPSALSRISPMLSSTPYSGLETHLKASSLILPRMPTSFLRTRLWCLLSLLHFGLTAMLWSCSDSKFVERTVKQQGVQPVCCCCQFFRRGVDCCVDRLRLCWVWRRHWLMDDREVLRIAWHGQELNLRISSLIRLNSCCSTFRQIRWALALCLTNQSLPTDLWS